MPFTFSTLGVIGVIVLFAGYLAYQALLPKPIPGIPYNKEAAKRLFGDVPELMKWRSKGRPEVFAWITEQTVKMDSPIIQLFMRPFGRPW